MEGKKRQEAILFSRKARERATVYAGVACMVAAALGAGCLLEPPEEKMKASKDLCEAQSRLAKRLEVDSLVLGVMTTGTEERFERHIEGVPYGLKYIYLSERARAGGPCSSCEESACSTPYSWWGCWNEGSGPRPGGRLRNLFSSSEAAGQIPMVVYYTFYKTIGEGTDALVQGLRNDDNVRDYFDDWRFMLETVNEYQQESNKPVMLNIEPDLWGFAQQSHEGRNGPENVRVNVQSTTRGDCPDEANSFAGFAKCMVRMARHYAPQASIGLMASGWATGEDINLSTHPHMDVEGMARSTGEYLNRLGANWGDFLVVEFSDRDAGYYESIGQPTRWYDENNQSFPNFHRTFLWGKTLAETVKLPLVWWQIPMGNNTTGPWRDNRVDYLFAHLDEVAENHGIALAFGPGDDNQTSPATDGGNLAGKVRAYAKTSGQALMCVQP